MIKGIKPLAYNFPFYNEHRSILMRFYLKEPYKYPGYSGVIYTYNRILNTIYFMGPTIIGIYDKILTMEELREAIYEHWKTVNKNVI